MGPVGRRVAVALVAVLLLCVLDTAGFRFCVLLLHLEQLTHMAYVRVLRVRGSHASFTYLLFIYTYIYLHDCILVRVLLLQLVGHNSQSGTW